MAIPSEKAAPLEQDTSTEVFPEAMVDVDEMIGDDSEDALDASAANDRFACSAELRRKIEERLEMKMLKDELGFDDEFDL